MSLAHTVFSVEKSHIGIPIVEFSGDEKFKSGGSSVVTFCVNVALGHNTLSMDTPVGVEEFRVVLMNDVVFWINDAFLHKWAELFGIISLCEECTGKNGVWPLIVDKREF